jgi:hypothetical protein
MSDDTKSTSADAGLLERFIDPDQLKKDLAIDPANITASLSNQTQLFVHYASAAVRSKRQFERWKAAVDILEAQLDSQVRKEVAENGGKITEGAVRATVLSDPKMKAARARMIDAQEIHRLCDVAERAFEHRREMVKQIAQDLARESEGQLRVYANQDAASARDRLLERMQKSASGAA